MATTFFKKVNFGRGTLNSGITDVATSMTLDAGHTLPGVSGDFRVALYDAVTYPYPDDDINMEIVTANWSSGNIYNITRAQEGTTGVAHSAGDRVSNMITGESLEQLETAINARTERALAEIVTGAWRFDNTVWIQKTAIEALLVSKDADGGDIFVVNTTAGVVTLGGVAPVTGCRLVLPLENDAVTPTLAFGDGDSGFYESSDDSLSVALGGLRKWVFQADVFTSNDLSNGPSMRSEVPSDTNPVFLPRRDDLDTGLGGVAADSLSLIAGGVEGIRITETAAAIITEMTGTVGINTGTFGTAFAGGIAILLGAINTADVTDQIHMAVIDDGAGNAGLAIRSEGGKKYFFGSNFGQGTFTPDAGLHVNLQVSGPGGVPAGITDSISAIIQANVNTTDGCALYIIGGTAGSSSIRFADSGNKDVGTIHVYHSGDYMAFGVGGSTRLRINSDGATGIGIDPVTGCRLLLPLENDPVTPTLSFGDGNSGFYEASDNVIILSLAGVGSVTFDVAWLFSTSNAAGWAIVDETPTSTNPVFTFRGDTDTGMGRGGADQIALIAGAEAGIVLAQGAWGCSLHIPEITTPTAITSWGAIYTKADNKLYFQDGAGTEYTVTIV